LKRYSKEYKVEGIIEMRKADIGHYVIDENEFDLIVAVSTLEHVELDEVFEYVLKQMAVGTKMME
jgi:2-polyprenyl-3-methyl-5-hydroxy-6-metoxy-1,4-benzoquinol methylase